MKTSFAFLSLMLALALLPACQTEKPVIEGRPDAAHEAFLQGSPEQHVPGAARHSFITSTAQAHAADWADLHKNIDTKQAEAWPGVHDAIAARYATIPDADRGHYAGDIQYLSAHFIDHMLLRASPTPARQAALAYHYDALAQSGSIEWGIMAEAALALGQDGTQVAELRQRVAGDLEAQKAKQEAAEARGNDPWHYAEQIRNCDYALGLLAGR